MGKTEIREEQLLKELENVKTIKLADIIKKFGISTSTARRLCVDLEAQGKVARCFGGIQYLPTNYNSNQSRYSYNTVAKENLAEKETIAQAGARFVKSGELIYITGGTTMYHFALALADRIKSGEIDNITVMTNSIDNADALAKDARVIITGGNYRSMQRDMAGLLCEKVVQKSYFDKSFLGVDGIDIAGGLMTFDIDTARIDQLVLANAGHAYILTDNSKFKRNSFISYGTIHKDCTIITDSGVSKEIVEKAASEGIDLLVINK